MPPPPRHSSSKAELARLALEGGEEEQEEGITFADKIGAMMRASHFPLGEVTIEYRDLRVVRRLASGQVAVGLWVDLGLGLSRDSCA